MIKKVEIITNIQPQTELEKSILRVFNGVTTKLNEVIGVVNELQTEVNKMAQNINFAQPEVKETAQDPYAEQRKWIGCVCRFWYDNPDDTVLDYLGKIQTGENGIEYYGKETYD